ncbi:MAG: hypothetical protein LBD37_06785 [Treponema sp.]|nr:hypothetical protein [Treponema sp.]
MSGLKPGEPAGKGARRVFQYPEEDHGKAADYATAYENSRGQRGPWSNATSPLISG